MAPLRSSSSTRPAGIRRVGDDAFKLTIDYVKQEAFEPLKGLGRFVAWGLAGSFAIAVGILLLLIGILRVLQEETGTALTGDWSWVPYFVVSVIGIGVAGFAAWRIVAGPAKRKLPQHAKKSTETTPEAPVLVARTSEATSSTARTAGSTASETGSGATGLTGATTIEPPGTQPPGTQEGTI